MISRIMLTLAVLTIASFVLLVLIGLWDRYEQKAVALGFSGIYERSLASQAGFPDDAKAYRAANEAKRAQQAWFARVTAALEE